MTRPKIIVHCLIKNEERFIWYALKSVLPFVDKIMVWDTGSTDNTVQIIKSIKSAKIDLKILKSINALQHTKLRQQMLKQTPKEFTWLMILDGDEIWPEKSIKKVVNYLKIHPDISSLVVRSYNSVGDIYHRLPKSAGQYQIAGQKGHLALRFINLSLPGLKIVNPHGRQTYISNGRALQNLKTIKILNTYYLHATHLKRSSKDGDTLKRSFKRKFEIGERLKEKDLPKIFFSKHPSIVPTVTGKMDYLTLVKSLIQTPVRRIKRRVFKPESGY